MSEGSRRALRWLFWSIGILAFVVVLGRAAPGDALPIIMAVGPWVGLAALPYLAQIALDALAWRTLLVAIERPVAWRRLIAVRLSTEAVLMSVPGGSLIGESLKPYLLSRSANVPIADTVASIGIKRSLLAIAQAGYLVIALTVGHTVLSRVSVQVIGTSFLVGALTLAAAVLAIAGVGLALAFLRAGVADRTRGLLARIPSRRLRMSLEARRAGFTATDRAFVAIGRHRKHLGVAVGLLLAAWLVEAVETGVLCRLLGLSLSPAEVIAMEATIVLARNLAFFLPAGLGVQDAGYLAFLGALGVTSPAATAFVLVKRIKELAWITVGYVTLFALDRRRASSVTPAALATPLGVPLGRIR